MTDITPHSQATVNAFAHLVACLNTLCLHLYDELAHYPLWVMHDQEFVPDRDKLMYALKHFALSHHIAPQETWVCPGAVACNTHTLQLIHHVNQAKDDLRHAADAYKAAAQSNSTQPIRDLLATHGYGRVKLKQVYRHIRAIPYHPARIAWTKGKAYAHRIITREEARDALLKTGRGENIDIQLAKLSLLKPTDKLVKRRNMKPYWVVNITHYQGGETRHHKLATSLPLFYLHDTTSALPTVCFSKKSNRGNTTVRADKQVEDVPFLKSISAYRYKQTRVNTQHN